MCQHKQQIVAFLKVLEELTPPIFQPSPLASREELETFAGINPATKRPHTPPLCRLQQTISDVLLTPARRTVDAVTLHGEAEPALHLAEFFNTNFKG